MKKVGISVVFFVILSIVLFISCLKRPHRDVKYHVVIVPFETNLKPTIPSKSLRDYCVIVNQSSFNFETDPSSNQFTFTVSNKDLTEKELEVIGTQLVPLDCRSQFYIF